MMSFDSRDGLPRRWLLHLLLQLDSGKNLVTLTNIFKCLLSSQYIFVNVQVAEIRSDY